MRLEHIDRCDEAMELEAFSNWIATIGGANDGHANIIPQDFLIQHFANPIATIVHSTFPSYSTDVADTSYFTRKSNISSNFGDGGICQSILEFLE